MFPISTRLIAGAVVTAGLVSCAGRAIGTAAGDAGGGAPDAGRKADAGGADAGPDGGATFDGGWYYDGGPWWGDGGVYNVGWTELPNTRLASVCFDPANGCAPVISAWNSGVADPVRSRLLFWGGGHNDYGGNEIYSLNLLAGTLTRVTGQSPPAYCQEASTDGRPNARHTYDGIALLAGMDQVFEYGGYLSCDGSAAGISRATWKLRLSDLSWTRMDPTLGTGPVTQADCCDYIAAADFDPLTQKVYLHDDAHVWSYDASANTYVHLSDDYGVDYHETGVIDPVNRLFILFGGGQVRAWDIGADSGYAMQTWDSQTTGCTALQGAAYPGLDYDSALGAIVGWVGGGSVYVFDSLTKTCQQRTYNGGPGPAQVNGTYKRWRYFASLDVFAVVNDGHEDAFVLRLQ